MLSIKGKLNKLLVTILILLLVQCKSINNKYRISELSKKENIKNIFLQNNVDSCGIIDEVEMITLEENLTFITSLYYHCPNTTGNNFSRLDVDYNITVLSSQIISAESYVGKYTDFLTNMEQRKKINFIINDLNDDKILGISKCIEFLNLQNKKIDYSIQFIENKKNDKLPNSF